MKVHNACARCFWGEVLEFDTALDTIAREWGALLITRSLYQELWRWGLSCFCTGPTTESKALHLYDAKSNFLTQSMLSRVFPIVLNLKLEDKQVKSQKKDGDRTRIKPHPACCPTHLASRPAPDWPEKGLAFVYKSSLNFLPTTKT